MRDCFACAFAHPFAEPGGQIDFNKRVCRKGPPGPVVIPTGPNSLSINFVQPAVARGMWCYAFEPAGEAAIPAASAVEEREH